MQLPPISVQVEAANGRSPRREITLTAGDRQHVDVADPLDGFQRAKMLDRAAARLCIPRHRLQDVEDRIIQAAESPPDPVRFPLLSSAALDNTACSPRPIISGALFADHPHVIGGLFKTGKTLFAIDAAISLATGRPFLGSFTVPEPLTVVYFSGEGGPSLGQEYGRRIARSKGMGLADATNLHWCFRVPRLEDLHDLDGLSAALKDTAAEVAFFDNLMLCLSGNEAGNVMRMAGILGNVNRLCGERGVTPVYIHHFKRTRTTADPYAPGELADLTQAGAAETAGQWWLLTRREPYDPDQPGEHRLWLSIGGRLGLSSLHAVDAHEGRVSDSGGRRWEVDLFSPEDAKVAASEHQRAQKDHQKATERAARFDAAKKTIADAMLKLGPASKTSIQEASGIHHRDFAGPFGEMIRDGHVVSCEITRPNRKTPYQGYKLAE